MTIYVTNLAQDIANEDLWKAFSVYGSVISVKIIRDRFSADNRSVAYVDMPDNVAAQNAMLSLYNTLIKGRHIRVAKARQAPEQKADDFVRVIPGSGIQYL